MASWSSIGTEMRLLQSSLYPPSSPQFQDSPSPLECKGVIEAEDLIVRAVGTNSRMRSGAPEV